ncbi:hypothetical protein [Sorangium cellulosum]|uniref:Uncharacterized protein n=2 Tax=Sorangium cellulosum TaxID=56 RepID=A0A150U0W4_SORCE|nr:hypothetical protein [Sorangium cellulosum]AGP40191.1 hypothetical protein SCE1572_40220 [Sorangium cellulosum So0157-2]KYG10457.1 hypothetical protein BE21_11855 [Sorangium cellulosum]
MRLAVAIRLRASRPRSAAGTSSGGQSQDQRRRPEEGACVAWEELELLREASEWLLANLTPDGARRPAAKQRGEAEAMRDRLWTLLVRRYAELRKIGYYFHGNALEDVNPKLQSRVVNGAAEEAEEDAGEEREADEEPEEATPTSARASQAAMRRRTLWTVRPTFVVVFSPRFRLTPNPVI